MSAQDEVRNAVNTALHVRFGAEPCRSVCSHVIVGRWTALGIANVIARQQAIEGDACSSSRNVQPMSDPYRRPSVSSTEKP